MSVIERLLTDDEYLALVKQGVFTNTQLICGKVYQNVTPSWKHVEMVERLAARLRETYGPEYVLQEQPVIANGFPEPDITILARPRSELEDHPTPDDIFAVIEVGLTSADSDIDKKGPAYVEAGIEQVYVVTELDMKCVGPKSNDDLWDILDGAWK